MGVVPAGVHRAGVLRGEGQTGLLGQRGNHLCRHHPRQRDREDVPEAVQGDDAVLAEELRIDAHVRFRGGFVALHAQEGQTEELAADPGELPVRDHTLGHEQLREQRPRLDALVEHVL